MDYVIVDEEKLDEDHSFLLMSKEQIGTWSPGELILTAGPTIGSLEKKTRVNRKLHLIHQIEIQVRSGVVFNINKKKHQHIMEFH